MAILLGLLNQADLFDNRVTTIGVERVSRDIDASVAEHNRVLNAMMALFVTTRTDPQTNYKLAGSTRNQPLDENGRARPIKFAGSYTVGFPLHFSGNAWGANYVTSIEMTLGEIADIMSTLLDGDSRWMRDHILAALFFENSTSPWVYTDPQYGALNIYGMANGDTTTYQIMSGADSAATDDHVKGAAAVTEAVFQDIHDELVEHPGNGTQVITFIPTASSATVQALTNFYPITDPNLRSGVAVTEFVGALGVVTPGKLIGYIAGCHVYEWPQMPSGYIIGTTVGGAPPLALRQKPIPSLQGFNKVAERADYPWWEAQYLRIAGFGAWNRVGAVIYKTDNVTYSVPTGYSSPMV